MRTRQIIIDAIQSRHDETCYDYSCKCHDRYWSEELSLYVSQVAIDEGDRLCETIIPEEGEYFVQNGKVRKVLESEHLDRIDNTTGYTIWVEVEEG